MPKGGNLATPALRFAILGLPHQPGSEFVKFVLFHAIEPDFVKRGRHDWDSFLRDAADVKLPLLGERLSLNVWLFPDNPETERALRRLGERWSVETQIRAFAGASDWQSLSSPS
jgi:hypothetical protein